MDPVVDAFLGSLSNVDYHLKELNPKDGYYKALGNPSSTTCRVMVFIDNKNIIRNNKF